MIKTRDAIECVRVIIIFHSSIYLNVYPIGLFLYHSITTILPNEFDFLGSDPDEVDDLSFHR